MFRSPQYTLCLLLSCSWTFPGNQNPSQLHFQAWSLNILPSDVVCLKTCSSKRTEACLWPEYQPCASALPHQHSVVHHLGQPLLLHHAGDRSPQQHHPRKPCQTFWGPKSFASRPASVVPTSKGWPRSKPSKPGQWLFRKQMQACRMDDEHDAESWAVWCSPVSLAASPGTGQSRDLSGTVSNPPKQGNPPQYSPETFLLEITNNSPPPLQRSSPPPSYVCLNRTPCGPWWTRLGWPPARSRPARCPTSPSHGGPAGVAVEKSWGCFTLL